MVTMLVGCGSGGDDGVEGLMVVIVAPGMVMVVVVVAVELMVQGGERKVAEGINRFARPPGQL